MYAYDLRNHIAASLDHDEVADLQSEAFDFIFVVQRRARHGHPANHRRFHVSHGGESRRCAQPGLRYLSTSVTAWRAAYLKAMAQRGALAVNPNRALLRDGVDLYDDPIDLVGQALPLQLPFRGKTPAPHRCWCKASVEFTLKRMRVQPFERLPVCRKAARPSTST